jgi:hypothetical protein
MGKGLPRSTSRQNAATSPIQKQLFRVNNRVLAVANGAPGFGTVVIGDFPEGNILFLGAIAYLQFSTADADVTATFDGDYSVGITPTADNVLSTTDADIIPSTPLGAATGKLSPVVRGASTDALGGGILDNTDGSLELNLNLLIDDAAISGAADFTVNGYVQASFIVLGDD